MSHVVNRVFSTLSFVVVVVVAVVVVVVVRWIKFEEDVEGSGWGRPHISALTFHSLAALRKTLESGESGEGVSLGRV